ncbi:hypothetical protein BFS06_14255 [Clostridium perfringens]|uniref:hypothetical protein n=1 Tax=Clostridium perfringens TaxID=1502 RepID=UPI00103ED93D|nr:hypothetical protein [Clostridium perfringens]TBX14368.1 hypothetical protein BFS06_14255 [Clostridium perfringens]
MDRNIAKEVKLKMKDNGIDISGEYDIEFNMHCPNCDSIVGDYDCDELYFNFCPECDQRLKYTETDE